MPTIANTTNTNANAYANANTTNAKTTSQALLPPCQHQLTHDCLGHSPQQQKGRHLLLRCVRLVRYRCRRAQRASTATRGLGYLPPPRSIAATKAAVSLGRGTGDRALDIGNMIGEINEFRVKEGGIRQDTRRQMLFWAVPFI